MQTAARLVANASRRRRSALPALAVLGLLCSASLGSARAQLLNPGFEVPNASLAPPNYLTSITGLGAFGPSSAADWNLFNNTNTMTSTVLAASTDTLHPGGNYMIHVATTGKRNGLYQILPANLYTASVDVLVKAGTVTLYTYDNGVLVNSVSTSTLNVWQNLHLPAATFNEFIIYSGSGSGNNFYADNASTAAPAPGGLTTVLLIGLGLFGLTRLTQHLRHAA